MPSELEPGNQPRVCPNVCAFLFICISPRSHSAIFNHEFAIITPGPKALAPYSAILPISFYYLLLRSIAGVWGDASSTMRGKRLNHPTFKLAKMSNLLNFDPSD